MSEIKSTDAEMVTLTSSYRVEEVHAGLTNLVDLIDVICEIRFNLGCGEGDRRLGSLLWIARDLAEGVLEREEETRRVKLEGGKC